MHELFVSLKKTNRCCASVLKLQTVPPLKTLDFLYLDFSQITYVYNQEKPKRKLYKNSTS
jgi:hypothetical protein